MTKQSKITPRQPHDQYPSPPWAIETLFDEVPDLVWKARGRWLEPSCGSGNIIKTANQWMDKHWATEARPTWFAVEIDGKYESEISQLTSNYLITDFLTLNFGGKHSLNKTKTFDVGIMNQPYKHALPFVQKMLDCCEQVYALMNTSFMEGQARQSWHFENRSDLLVLSKRPGFVEGSKDTDKKPYAWFCWPGSGLWRPVGPVSERFKKS